MIKKKQKRVSLAASLCWLLLTVIDCSAMMASPAGEIPNGSGTSGLLEVDYHHSMNTADMDHGEMDCCDPIAPSCCEPVSFVVPSKLKDFDDNPLHLTALLSACYSLISYSPPEYPTVAPNWRLHTPPLQLHLLNCSFLN